MHIRRLLALAGAALACGGCGLAAGSGTKAVTVTVTRGFGGRQIAQMGTSQVPSSETVTRMLDRSFHVTTLGRDGLVESIDGLGPGGPQTGWSYYINGILGRTAPTGTTVHAGDHIWWDLHDHSATRNIPAVVGSFPEPFVNGIGGKRYPVTIECANDVSTACRRVTAAMNAAHVPAAPQLLGTGSGPDTLGIVVGTWSEISSQVGAELVAYGPGASGVYARFVRRGSDLELLSPTGRVARTLGAGAGLIAATGDSSNVPTWMITGTDVAGVTAAARALSAQALHNHFAVAVDGSKDLPVPLQGSS